MSETNTVMSFVTRFFYPTRRKIIIFVVLMCTMFLGYAAVFFNLPFIIINYLLINYFDGNYLSGVRWQVYSLTSLPWFYLIACVFGHTSNNSRSGAHVSSPAMINPCKCMHSLEVHTVGDVGCRSACAGVFKNLDCRSFGT